MIYTVFNINYQNLFIAKFLNRVKNSCIKCPHVFLSQVLDENTEAEREAGMFLGLQMLKRCNQLFVFGSTISEGMQKEIAFAKKHNIPIRYFNTECEEVTQNGLY